MLPVDGIRGLLACLWLSLRVSRVVSDVVSCDDESFVLLAAYDRTINRTSIELQTTYTTGLVSLEDTVLTSSYSWVNVSQMEAERTFSMAQADLLAELVSRFPRNDTVTVSYTVSDATVMLIFTVDSSYALSVGSSVEATKGLNETFLKPYLGGRNVTDFIKSRPAVLSRWREICRKTVKMDSVDNASMAFFYHPDRSTFECSVVTPIPVKYYVYVTCPGTNISVEVGKMMRDGVVRGNLTLPRSPRCEVAAANCTVSSPYKWVQTLKAVIPPATEKLSGVGVDAAVSATMVILVLGLLVFVYFRYRSSMGPVRELIGLIRGRMGYGSPGERCTCINSVSTEE